MSGIIKMAVARRYYTTPDSSKTVFSMFHHSAVLHSFTHSCIMKQKSSHLPKAFMGDEVLNVILSKNGSETTE